MMYVHPRWYRDVFYWREIFAMAAKAERRLATKRTSAKRVKECRAAAAAERQRLRDLGVRAVAQGA